MNLGIDSSRNLIPLGGVLAATVLQVLAATRYPGGYDWFDQTLSALFQPTALNDAPNASRPLAILAVLTFCASIAIAFNMVARKGPSRFHRKTIQIAGIASMVYTALVVTPMHDVLIGIALLFFVIAMFTIFHWLFVERRLGMLAAGVGCLALTLFNATTYFAGVLYASLPVVQKVSLALWVFWLIGLSWNNRPRLNRGPGLIE